MDKDIAILRIQEANKTVYELIGEILRDPSLNEWSDDWFRHMLHRWFAIGFALNEACNGKVFEWDDKVALKCSMLEIRALLEDENVKNLLDRLTWITLDSELKAILSDLEDTKV